MIAFDEHIFHPVVVYDTPLPVFDFTESYDPDEIQEKGWGVGRYDERRVPEMYNSHLYEDGRSIHVGIDVWGPAGTLAYAFTNGRVYAVTDNDNPRDYGPTVVTEHRIDGTPLYALYGHLSKASIGRLSPGDTLCSGDVVGRFGEPHENGGWPPHLHFQLSYDAPDGADMPGVVTPEQRATALDRYPDPRKVMGPVY